MRPPWEPALAEPEPGTIEIVVDPGQAFGTGGHASTRLCLALLLELAAADGVSRAVLDVGTGSGVLAIAAARLGFAPLLGLDNEIESVHAAAENAGANGVDLKTERFDLRTDPLPWLGDGADAGAGPAPGATIVLANLLRPLLLGLAGALERPPFALIAGGLLVGELDEVAAAFEERAGLTERERRVEGDWGALWLVTRVAAGSQSAAPCSAPPRPRRPSSGLSAGGRAGTPHARSLQSWMSRSATKRMRARPA